jgi:hypothetical protein
LRVSGSHKASKAPRAAAAKRPTGSRRLQVYLEGTLYLLLLPHPTKEEGFSSTYNKIHDIRTLNITGFEIPRESRPKWSTLMFKG